jgi:hypothetical protein
MEDSTYDSDSSRDEEMGGYDSSDPGSGEEDPFMYGIRAPRRNTAREWRFDSLRVSHLSRE